MLGANVENLILMPPPAALAVSLAAASRSTRQATAWLNVLTGTDGENILDGGAGADTLAGGLGNDTYVLGDELDTVVEAVNGGWDTITSTISRDLNDYPNVENLTLLGFGQHQRHRQQVVEHPDRQ